MTKLRAHFDGKVLVPDEPVDLPLNRELEIHVDVVEGGVPAEQEPQNDTRPLENLLRALEQATPNPDWPEDGAAQHDHYLYGVPKRP